MIDKSIESSSRYENQDYDSELPENRGLDTETDNRKDDFISDDPDHDHEIDDIDERVLVVTDKDNIWTKMQHESSSPNSQNIDSDDVDHQPPKPQHLPEYSTSFKNTGTSSGNLVLYENTSISTSPKNLITQRDSQMDT